VAKYPAAPVIAPAPFQISKPWLPLTPKLLGNRTNNLTAVFADEWQGCGHGCVLGRKSFFGLAKNSCAATGKGMPIACAPATATSFGADSTIPTRLCRAKRNALSCGLGLHKRVDWHRLIAQKLPSVFGKAFVQRANIRQSSAYRAPSLPSVFPTGSGANALPVLRLLRW